MPRTSNLLPRLQAMDLGQTGCEALRSLREEVWARMAYVKKKGDTEQHEVLKKHAQAITTALRRAAQKTHALAATS
eukprot:13753956-Alexandrium_andersonii.AAC.1